MEGPNIQRRSHQDEGVPVLDCERVVDHLREVVEPAEPGHGVHVEDLEGVQVDGVVVATGGDELRGAFARPIAIKTF